MISLTQLAQSFGRSQPSSLCEELLEVAGEVQSGLPAFYWLGPYRLQRRRLGQATRRLQRELAESSQPAELAGRALAQLHRLRRRLTAAHRALLAGNWPLMQRELAHYKAHLGGLSQLTDQLEEVDLQS